MIRPRKPLRLGLAGLIVGCVIFVYFSTLPASRPLRFLHASLFGYRGSGDDDGRTLLSADEKLVRDVRVFWKPFERAILAAEPKMPPVELRGSAQNRRPRDGDPSKPRPLPEDYTLLEEEGMDALKKSHARFMAVLDDAFEDQPLHAVASGLFNGPGVVTVAGGEYYGPALLGIQMLRATGSSLPVEAFLANEDEYDENMCERVFPLLGAKCLIITEFLDDPLHNERLLQVSHFQLKALALLFSSFQHTLLLDSDSIPLYDPTEEFFNSEPYLSTGFVGWPDIWQGTESAKFYQITGHGDFPADLPSTSSETGQILVDKNRHLKALLLAAYYNIWGPDYYYPLLSQGALGQGDKNTFETATYVLGQPWYRVKTEVRIIGREANGKFKGTAMVQHHPTDDAIKYDGHRGPASVHNDTIKIRPAFIHSNTPKMNAGHLVDEGDLTDKASGLHLRLWGTLQEQQDLFGEDVEKRVWTLLVESGCDYADIVPEWKHRSDICERLKEHFERVFSS
jgi:alpha 1,2-mannosyltransferase